MLFEVRELENGYAYSFPGNADWLFELAKLVDLERQGCPFMQFCVIVEPANGPIWLQMTAQWRSLRASSPPPRPGRSY